MQAVYIPVYYCPIRNIYFNDKRKMQSSDEEYNYAGKAAQKKKRREEKEKEKERKNKEEKSES